MTTLLLALVLAATPTLEEAEAQAVVHLRGCYVETRLKFADQDDTVLSLCRCGGPRSEPRSYIVGFVFRKAGDGRWVRLEAPLTEVALRLPVDPPPRVEPTGTTADAELASR